MYQEVKRRLEAACQRSSRAPDEVTLVAVTKGRSVATIQHHILDQGHTILGENRIQEWREKAPHLAKVEWHFIGNLQRNKVRYCLPFHLIHSLNSERLADALQALGERKGHIFRVLVEVNVAGEASKQGLSPPAAAALVRHAATLPNVTVTGLMTMAPFTREAEASRQHFRTLRRLRDKLGLVELSMGMSADFEVAVEEGATIVRIGTALFE